MLRCCALGKALAEAVSFRTSADDFPVVIKRQESVLQWSQGMWWELCAEGGMAVLTEQAYFQAEPNGLIHKCNFSSVHHRNQAG